GVGGASLITIAPGRSRAHSRRRRHPPHRRRVTRPVARGARRPRHPLAAMSDALPVALIDTIRARLGDRARPGEPLARYTSFRIGGPADLLVLPDTADELAHVLVTTAAFGVRLTLLGGGSNVLVGDSGMRGVVVKLGRGFARITWNDTGEAERESAQAARGGSRAGVELGRAADAARVFDRSAARAARTPD